MSINYELAKRAEEVARQICKEINKPESMWELVLPEAYERIMKKEKER